MNQYQPKSSVLLPPKDAKVVTTACDYCIVGCGYKAFVWPEGTSGGQAADQNALGVDFPVAEMSGSWVSPNEIGSCMVDGKRHHLVVLPDPDATVVNVNGNHSIRGGCLAKKAYDPQGRTADRLHDPLMRVNGELVPVSWETAIEVMAQLSKYIIEKHGRSS